MKYAYLIPAVLVVLCLVVYAWACYTVDTLELFNEDMYS